MVLELDEKSLMELVEKNFKSILEGCAPDMEVLKNALVIQLIPEPTHYGELFI